MRNRLVLAVVVSGLVAVGVTAYSLEYVKRHVTVQAQSPTSEVPFERTSVTSAIFDRTTIAKGDTVGNFTVTDATPTDASSTLPILIAQFSGALTIVGKLDTSVGIAGPFICDITPETAVGIPHPSDEPSPSCLEIDTNDIPGADKVKNGDTVEANIDTTRIDEVPKDGAAYGATFTAIQSILGAPKAAVVKGPPAIPELSIQVPEGWIITQNSESGVRLVSPDFTERDTLADAFKQNISFITSGRSIDISYQRAHIIPSDSPKDFVTFEESFLPDCSNCKNLHETTLGGQPAVIYTAAMDGDTTTILMADHSSDEVDIDISPAITTVVDELFLEEFMQGIHFTQ